MQRTVTPHYIALSFCFVLCYVTVSFTEGTILLISTDVTCALLYCHSLSYSVSFAIVIPHLPICLLRSTQLIMRGLTDTLGNYCSHCQILLYSPAQKL